MNEGKTVKQVFQAITPGTFYALVCTHSEPEHVQKTITDRQPHPKSRLVKTGIFLSTVKLTTKNAPPIPSLLIGQVNNCRTAVMELCGGAALVSNEIRKQGHVVGANFDATADQQYDLSAASGRRLLRRTLLEEQPTVVVASPPCAYLAGFSKLNAKHSPETFAEKNEQKPYRLQNTRDSNTHPKGRSTATDAWPAFMDSRMTRANLSRNPQAS
eukprot:1918143-Amphidinium_carterae.3